MTERSILAAVSGVDANQTFLDSIGNNIANADTVGYKDSEVQFQDLLSEQLAGASGPTATAGGINPVAIGSGVAVVGNSVNLQEGSLAQTGNPSDVAIQGNGYLVVDNSGTQEFTRNGALTVDANGNLTTQSGGLIMGWQANAAGAVNTNAPIVPLKIPQGATIGATPTTTMTLGGNLTAGSAAPETATYNAYDALGNKVPITLTFTPIAGTNNWTVQGTLPSGQNLWTSPGPEVQFSNTGTISTVAANGSGATITTNADGSIAVTTGTAPSAFTGYNFAAGSTLSFEFPPPSSSSAVTQYSSSQTIDVQSQNGYPSGTLQSYSIGSDGTISGSFSNGATLSLGQIALAGFANPSGLADQGGGLYATTANSGQALIGTPGTGGRGTILGGELEQSNVDLGTALTELITAQQAYTANTKVLTTSDQVIQALENVP